MHIIIFYFFHVVFQVLQLTSGVSIALEIRAENAVTSFREIAGKQSNRVLCFKSCILHIIFVLSK